MDMPATPSTEDAQLVLKLYDLRREEVMRASRSTMLRWMPANAEDCIAITRFDHPDNAAYRQVSSYFEMAYGFARHGAVHAELLAEGCGEGLFLFAKVKPWLAELRQATRADAFRSAEWVAENTARGRELVPAFEARIASLRAASQGG
jgi:hypothetical protein